IKAEDMPDAAKDTERAERAPILFGEPFRLLGTKNFLVNRHTRLPMPNEVFKSLNHFFEGKPSQAGAEIVALIRHIAGHAGRHSLDRTGLQPKGRRVIGRPAINQRRAIGKMPEPSYKAP